MESMARRLILARRVGYSIVCCAAFQFTVLLFILTPLTVNAWQPTLWMRNVRDVSLNVVVYTVPLSLILCLVCLINNEDTESAKKLLPSRFSTVCNLFTLRNVILSASYTLIGGFIFYLYASLIGGEFGKLVTDCTGYYCLLESQMYLILCGFWIGQTYFLKNYVFENQPVIHLVIQQHKLLQVKSELKPLIKHAFTETIWPTIFFALAYYFKGDSIRDHFCELFYIKFDDVPLSARFINVTLLVYSWFLGSIFFASMNSVKMILHVFTKDHMIFPITKPQGNTNCITLHEALKMKTLPGVQHLGYHDLLILSATDARRREELFSLSLLGGHPHNWNAIIEECLQFVNSFSAELSHGIDTLIVEPLVPATNPPIANQLPNPQTPFNQQSPRSPPTPFSPINSPSGMRPLYIQPVGIVMAPPHTFVQRLRNGFKKQIKLLKDNIAKRPVVAFVFGELPESKINHTLSKVQPVIWAVQSLSLLAAASYHEDKFGVAQKDLPAIIAALLNLKQLIDKLHKSGIYKKIPRKEHYNTKLRHAIRSAVKRSLYRISVTFGGRLQELPIPKDVLPQLQNFILNREC